MQLSVIAYLLATVMEERMARANLDLTANRPLRVLRRLQVVDYEDARYQPTQLTVPTPEMRDILSGLGTRSSPTASVSVRRRFLFRHMHSAP